MKAASAPNFMFMNKILNVYFNPKLSHNRKGTLEHTKASKQNHYLHREHVFRSYVVETRELMLRYYNFQFKSALCNVWWTLETFHRADHPIADFRSSIQSGLWNFGWFWFLEHNCLLFAKYEEVGWYKNIVFEISCKCFLKSMKLPWVTVTNHIWQASASVVECAVKQSNESWQMSWMDVANDFL